MAKQNDDFLKRLLATFRIEADEHLKAISAGLIELEKKPTADRYAEIIEIIFRDAHSLKGAALAVGLKEIGAICQPLESVLSALKGRQLAVSQPLFDLLYQAVDALGEMLAPDAGPVESRQAMLALLIRRLDDALQGRFAPSTTSQSVPSVQQALAEEDSGKPQSAMTGHVTAAALAVPGFAAESVRVSTRKLDTVMRQVEELLLPRLAAAQRLNELRDISGSFADWRKRRARMRPVLRLIECCIDGSAKGNVASAGLRGLPMQELSTLQKYLQTEHEFMKKLEERVLRLSKFTAHNFRSLAGMSDKLLHDVKEMHLLPFTTLLEIYPRFIRELAREQGKQVDLVIRGGEIEVDRGTLEKMKDPLMHLLRNCIDHGIEQPVMRQKEGKPPQGTITVSIAQKDGGKIELLVADDGAGIDVAKVKTAAGKLGLVSVDEAEKLSGQEVQALVFHSGISTSSIITDISGRGLGLAIVREKIEGLGGSVELESGPAGGTVFRIALPLLLTTFRGVLVRAGEHYFVIPALGVERVMRVAQQDIRTVENRATISFGGQAIALATLSEVLELPRSNQPDHNLTGTPGQIAVIILGTDRKYIAFRVDEIMGEQEVLVKTLGRQLVRVRNIAGASVLGTGRVVAVLNVPDLLKSAVKRATAPLAPVAAEQFAEASRRSVMVAEDSITARALLKNILESAGYLVTTAVDGIDAYTILKTGTFDLLVSDVEMPRMDGFDLTARIRADKQLGQLPVVLVTALGSPEQRERGIDVGANAYIVKSSFDQSNLLDIVEQLI
ncbi:MAG: hybrid sensor histidine kinase/response regulator [Burkholderiales bacterium]